MASINKHGWNNIKHEILSTCETHKEASVLEKYYVALYKTNDKQFGYNRTKGGETRDDARLNGCKIRSLRKAAKLTQFALAGLAGVTRRTIISWEQSERTPNADKIPALAAALHVTADELLKEG
jgi:DNA-binding XRE family transcriptional regulator